MPQLPQEKQQKTLLQTPLSEPLPTPDTGGRQASENPPLQEPVCTPTPCAATYGLHCRGCSLPIPNLICKMGESITPVFHRCCEGSRESFHGTLGIHTQWSYYNGAVTPPGVDVLASVSWSAEGE